MTDKLISDLTAHDTSLSAAVTISIASPGVISWTGHPLAINQPFTLATTGALPTGITAGATYYVASAGFGANSFEFSATAGGAVINTSGTQSGTHTIQGLPADDTLVEVQRSASTTATEKAPLSSIVKAYVKSWIAKADVGLGNVANSLQLVAASNLADLASALTARLNLGVTNKLVAGRYYYPPPVQVGSAGALVANQIRMFPFRAPYTATISEMFARVQSGSAGNFQLALYAADATTLLPTGTPVCKSNASGSTTTGTTNVTTALAANFQMQEGSIYWAAINIDNGTATIGQTVSGQDLIGNLIGDPTLANMSGGSNTAPTGLTISQTFNTWPDMTANTYSSYASLGGGAPAIGYKVTSVP